jgi:dihydrofolate reductase
MISLIVAMDPHRVIGLKNQLPWSLPEDLKHFRATTVGKPVIMGRQTFESIGRPLAQRKNIVLSHNKTFQAPGVIVVNSIEEALAAAFPAPEIMVIGGAKIYQQFLPIANRLYLSQVHQVYEGDTFFPVFSNESWVITQEVVYPEFTVQILDKEVI